MIDTGSEPNLIKSSLLKPGIRIDENDQISVSGITEGTVTTLGSTRLTISEIPIKFQVVSDDFGIPSDGILGSAFLKEGAEISYAHRHMDWQGNKFPFITNEKSHDESSRVTHDRVDAIEPEKKNVIIEHCDGNANRESVNSARGPTIPPTSYKRLERTKGIAVVTDSESERNFSNAESNQVKSLAKSDAHEHPDLRADHEYVYSNRKDSKASCRSKKNFYIFDTRTSYRDKGFRDFQLESRSQSIFYKEVMDIMSTDPCDTKRYRRSILFQDSKSVASRPLNIRLDKPNDPPP